MGTKTEILKTFFEIYSAENDYCWYMQPVLWRHFLNSVMSLFWKNIASRWHGLLLVDKVAQIFRCIESSQYGDDGLTLIVFLLLPRSNQCSMYHNSNCITSIVSQCTAVLWHINVLLQCQNIPVLQWSCFQSTILFVVGQHCRIKYHTVLSQQEYFSITCSTE